MLSTRFRLFHFFFLAFFFIFTGAGKAQETEIIDTSSYLPYDISDALDVNLMIAASNGYDSEIERLVSKGADINAASEEGATPLVYAVANKHLSTVKKILGHNPDIDRLTGAGDSPLHIAVKNQDLEIAEVLIRAGANTRITDRNGATPLHFAALYGSFYMADLLLYYDADPNIKANDGTTPLMAAIWWGYADIADLLMQNGSNIEARDKDGFTPFLIAAQNGDTLMMNLLLKEGVDIYEKNDFNYNALDLTIEANQKPAFELLLKKGDKWSSFDRNDINPYHIASAFGRTDMVNILENNNIPGKPGLRIDEISILPSARASFRDIYTGASVSFREPLIKAGFTAGIDIKPAYTRILMKTGENTYYQYYDKSSLVYAGLFKDFLIREYFSGTRVFASTSLSAGYSLGRRFKGTNLMPENKLRIIPAASIRFQLKHMIVQTGLEYVKSGFYRIGPLWLRIGLGYNFFLSNPRSPVKVIKWN
ncbi:MAG: ankyrin repeat domain-containing protein [Bacteroidota bacterium]|nr:ankyrin repeat domain-containing protein [Bacteroidota bacterium]